MKRPGIIVKIIVVFIALLISPARAVQVKEFSLDNGLKLLVIENHKAPIATFQVWYRVGSKDEPKGKTGISHLLEHMMFKGTKRYGPKSFSRIIQKNGGIDNAFTTRDFTMYFETLSSDRIELAMELEADRMQNLLLRPEDVKYERSVVMEERRMRYEDDPQNLLYEELLATAFKVHPYRNPVIGWMSDLASITQKDLLNHYRRYYRPDNAFIIVAGDVNAEEVYRKVKGYFGGIKPSGYGHQEIRHYNEPPQQGKKVVYLEKEAQLPYLLIAYHVPSFPEKDSVELDVLSTIVSGKSGVLYKKLVREKKIALNVFASYSGFYLDSFLFFFGGTPRPGKTVEELKEAILQEIQGLKETPPTEKQLQKARNQVEASFIMEQDSLFSLAEMVGTFELLGGWRLIDKYLEGVRKVRPQDIQRVAKKYFVDKNMTIGILIPEKKDKEE